MKDKQVNSPARNFFMYGLLFVTLYITAFSTAGAIWQIINIFVPDTVTDNIYAYQGAKEVLRGFVSALIVAAPIYLYMAWKTTNEMTSSKGMANSAIRRWLTYFTLFVAAIVVIISLIVTVNQLLSGETALRFFLHAFDVIFIAASVFGYYLRDLKRY